MKLNPYALPFKEHIARDIAKQLIISFALILVNHQRNAKRIQFYGNFQKPEFNLIFLGEKRKNLTRNQQKIDRKTKINNGECKGIEREIFNWKMTVRFFALLVFNSSFFFFFISINILISSSSRRTRQKKIFCYLNYCCRTRSIYSHWITVSGCRAK